MQNLTRNTMFYEVLNAIHPDSITNALAGNASNLFCEHMNDFSRVHINNDAAEFIKENAAKLEIDEIASIIESPDWIITEAARVFRETLAEAMQSVPNAEHWNDALERADHVLRYGKSLFVSSGEKYYVFADPISNAITRYYVIRAWNESEALGELLCTFEKDFETEDEDNTDGQFNDNGTSVNYDNLQMIGQFQFTKDCK